MRKLKAAQENKETIEKLRISLFLGGVDKETAKRFVALVERLQGEHVPAPEVSAIGEELNSLMREIDEAQRKRRRDIVSEMAASVLHVQRMS